MKTPPFPRSVALRASHVAGPCCAAALLAWLAACGADAGSGAAPEEETAEEPLYGLGTLARLWPNGIVPVCWQTPADHPDLQVMVQDIAKTTWPAAAHIRFTGWEDCGSTPIATFINHVTLAFSTQHDFRGNTSSLGYGRPTVTLISDDPSPGLARFRYEVIHELGHALGFAHEMKRPDNWVGGVPRNCGVASSDPDFSNYSVQPGGINLTTTYDVASVMNYGTGIGPGCNPTAFPGNLSAGDIAGVQRPDAYGPPRAPVVSGVLLDPRYLGQNGPDQPSGLRIEALLPTGDGHSWSFASQDVAPDFAVDGIAGWKVAGDLNGDGRPDLVDTIYLGQPGDGQPSGLRIATALSTGPGTWTFTSQDVAPDHAVDDMAHWQVAGELNGDGRPDLVDTLYLGQPGNGQPSGLRIATALSTGPGTWTFTSQDVAPDYAVDDMAHWKAAGDLDGDGRPDLFDTAYLGPNASGQPTGIRMYRALSTGPGTWTLASQDISFSISPDDLGNWQPATLNRDGRPDFVNIGSAHASNVNQVRTFSLISGASGNWSLRVQDLDAGPGGMNLAAWRVADVNGDGLSDLVNPAFLGAGAGLRIRTALTASSDGVGFVVTAQDVNANYTTDDTTNWKVMDVDGDGLADLVDVAYFGQTGPGQPIGLRVNAVVSHGNGKWTFASQDINASLGVDDSASWKVGG